MIWHREGSGRHWWWHLKNEHKKKLNEKKQKETWSKRGHWRDIVFLFLLLWFHTTTTYLLSMKCVMFCQSIFYHTTLNIAWCKECLNNCIASKSFYSISTFAVCYCYSLFLLSPRSILILSIYKESERERDQNWTRLCLNK